MSVNETPPSKLVPLPENGTDLLPSATSALPEAADSDLLSYVSVFSIILGTVMVAFSAPTLLITGTLLIVLGTALPLVWQINDSIFGAISHAARMLLNDAISELVLTNAESHARMLNRQCEEVKTALQHWLDSGKTEGTEQVKTLFHTFSAFYPAQMENLVQGNYRGTLLPMYVEAAWKYLTLMRCFYDYADTLNLTTVSFLSPKALVLDFIKRNTIIFCDTASASYNFGLSTIEKNHGNPDLGEKRPTWLEYNEYRNLMTVTALDLLATFIYLNPELYPGSTQAAVLNRKLLSCTITEERSSQWRERMHQTLLLNDFEAEHNRTTPVYLLNRFDFATLKTYIHGIETDGLTYSRCEVRSLDGFERTFKTAEKGTIHLGEEVNSRALTSSIFRVEADYRTGKGSNNSTNVAARLVTQLRFYTEQNNSVVEQRITFSSTPSEQRSFVDSIPVIPTTGKLPDPSVHTHYLGDWKMAFLGSADNPGFVSTWYLKEGKFTNSKPLVAVAESPIHLRQFFAVRAAGSIWDGNANVIPGGRFHGGDLVSLPAGGELLFKIDDLQDWIAGFYRVRIWHLRSTSPRNISISVTPVSGALSSKVSAEIPPATRDANYLTPAFEDLPHFSFPSSSKLLLLPGMGSVELRCTNTTLATTIVIDRIELLFDSPGRGLVDATPSDMSDINASNF